MTDPTVSEAPPASHIPDTHLGESNQSSSGNGSILSSLTGLPNIASAFPVLNSADRSKQANLDLNEDEDEDDSDEDDDDDNGGCELSHSSIFAVTNEPTKRDRLRHLKDKTKAAVKSGLRGETSDDTAADADGTDKDASTNGHKHKITRMLDSATPSITRVTSAIAHPKQAAKGKASGAVGTQISKLNEPSVDRETELKFVEAHEKRADAIANDDKQGRRDAEESIEVLTQRRRDLHIRMVMKQIDTVRTVRLRKIKFPKREDFLMRDEHGNVIKDNANIEQVDWLAWFSELALYYSQGWTAHYIEDWHTGTPELEPVELKKIRVHIARILVASGPWQQWLLHIRRVYRWDDPYETFLWACLYAFLWHTSHVFGFIYGYIFVSTIRRYIFPPTVDHVKESNERSRSENLSPARLDQLIEKVGSESWLQPLAEELGPWAQMQLGDLACILEMANNFYEWTTPRTTAYSLSFYGTAFFITMVGDMELCVKIVLLIVGFCFFFSFAISSHKPKYRYLFSPLKWSLWGVPTSAEWAFAELRLAAQNTRDRLVFKSVDEEDSSSSSESDYDSDDSYDRFTMASNFTTPPTTPSTSSDSASQDQVYPSVATEDPSLPSPPLSHKTPLASFPCRYLHHRRCTLFLTPYGLRLCTGTGVSAADEDKEIFHRPWSDLFELSKVASAAKARKELHLKFLGEDMAKSGKADMGEDKTMEKHLDVVRLGHFAGRRDEVFNSIIGFSGVRWQWKS